MQNRKNDSSQIEREHQQVLWVTHAGVMRAVRYYLETGKRSIT